MRSRTLSALAALGLFTLVSVAYTRPLLQDAAVKIASDPGDPILNTTVLWWNATTLPFSPAWWTPPFFYPHDGVAALTENLVGIGILSTPTKWPSANPILAYNLALFVTWPLSAFAAYLLVRHLTQREDAAIVAGFAFGFAPYRAAQLSHIQVLSIYWLPLALLGLHGYLRDRRRSWLVLFGVAWILQSLSNGYFMLMGGVLIAMWIAYFAASRGLMRQSIEILMAWTIASVPLVPIFLKYRSVHEFYGLGRSLDEIIASSAQPWAWTQVSNLTWLWPHVLSDRGTETDLFPGLTAAVFVCIAGVAFMQTRRAPTLGVEDRPRYAQRVLIFIACAGGLAALASAIVGPWRIDVWGLRLRMGNPGRAAAVALIAAALAFFTSRRIRAAVAHRPAGPFYASAAVVAAVLACGPRIAYGSMVWVDPAPYRWLMAVPGFSELRVPARFWMIGALALSVAAGLAFARLVPIRARWRAVACTVVVIGMLTEGWLLALPMGTVPAAWSVVEPPDRLSAVIELPLGADFDAAATYRSLVHRRRTVNGVSGYDPPAYTILQQGLNARDPEMLTALASLGPIDAVVDGAHDPDGLLTQYVMSVGATRVASDGVRTAYALPHIPPAEPPGQYWPARSVTASANPALAPQAIDGDLGTAWQVEPQQPGQWIAVDLGIERTVGGIEQAIGEDVRGYPRRLAVDVSLDGQSWREVFNGPTAAPAFLAAIVRPREIPVRVVFDQQQARFVRLRQIGTFEGGWTVAELRVFARPRPGYP